MKKSKDKILIFGMGQVGNFYLNYFNNETQHKASITDVDITDKKAIERVVDEQKPTVVINAAGKTNLEWIEENKVEAFRVNVLGSNNVAEVCSEKDIYYIFLSSGCVFESVDENDAKTEKSKPSPQSYYSWTKVWADDLVPWNKKEDFNYMILRLRQPVSSEISNKNMLIKLLTFTQFIDVPNTGTVIEDLMEWTKALMEKRYKGIINVANEGYSTPYKIALMLKEHVLPELDVNLMTKEELNAITPVKRVDTILDVTLLKEILGDGSVVHYEKRLETTIVSLRKNIEKADKEHVKSVLEKTMEHTKLRAVPNDVWHLLYKR